MKIYNSTEYIENPQVGDLQLRVNSMWDFCSRDVCFKTIKHSSRDDFTLISYDLRECIDVVDGIIIGGTRKVKNTKWKPAIITSEIINMLETDGYSISREFKTITNHHD